MNFLKWSESNTSSRSYKVGSRRTRLIVPDRNNDDVGEVNEFWSCDTLNSIYKGANSTDQPVRLGYWRQQKAAIQFYEKVLQKKEELWQVLKWISSFALFLYGVNSVRNNMLLNRHNNSPSTFFVMTDCLWGRLIREEIEKLLLVLDDFLMSDWRWVAKAGLEPCGLKLEGAWARGAHWLDLSLFKGSSGAWVGASSMPLVDDRAERKALLCNQWCIYLFYFYEKVWVCIHIGSCP